MSKVVALALNTAREAIRNRVLYSIVFFAVVMVAISALFGAASIGDQIKYVKDFSLMSISLFGVVIAIVLGVNLLHQELSKRTILNTLSKPVARWQFILGKFFGLLATLTIIVAMMGSGLFLFLAFLEGAPDYGLIVASTTALFEIMVVIAIAVFFSSLVVTPTLAGLLTAAAFVAGRSTAYLDYFLSPDHPAWLQTMAAGLYWTLPRLDYFLIGDRAVYGDLIEPGYFAYLFGYAAAYSAALLVLAMGLFSRREFR
jgi:ABC-type transport system involved in multi-copper enzyme maturation permease subunit